jgi:hypothetical protein
MVFSSLYWCESIDSLTELRKRHSKTLLLSMIIDQGLQYIKETNWTENDEPGKGLGC